MGGLSIRTETLQTSGQGFNASFPSVCPPLSSPLLHSQAVRGTGGQTLRTTSRGFGKVAESQGLQVPLPLDSQGCPPPATLCSDGPSDRQQGPGLGSVTDPLCHLSQGLQLPLVHEAELSDEVVEVLVAGVDVRLGPHAEDAVEVVDVHVHKDAEEAGQDLGADLLEVLGEGNSWGAGWTEVGHQYLGDGTLPKPALPDVGSLLPVWPLP